jgi:hypothetical protein
MKGNDEIHRRLTRGRARFSMGEMLTVNFHQPSHEFIFGVWHEFYILSIGTNPLGITSSFVHVGFGV